MRSKGAPEELGRRRELALRRLAEGQSAGEVARFLEVTPRTVHRWRAEATGGGSVDRLRQRLRPRPGRPQAPLLPARPVPGRPRKLDSCQEKVVLRWLTGPAGEHGFSDDCWTAVRVGLLIERELGVRLNPRYLCSWLRQRGCSPQKPRRVPRERKPDVIKAWCETRWPEVKKKRPQSRRGK